MKTSSRARKTTSVRASSRTTRGARASKVPEAARKAGALREPAVCESCAAVYQRRTWRRDRRLTHAMLERASWTRCPACRQRRSGVAYGRVLARGRFDGRRLAAIERRVHNVAERAGFTQPQRAVLSMDRTASGLEILTTSQKLAHRIVHELKKAFGGRARYVWSDDDGSLLATWTA